MSSRLCVPSQTENPLRLSPLFRDYWGEVMAKFTAHTDQFAKAACYVPRFYHAPDSEKQFAGVEAGGFRTYLLTLPIGSFILGYLHTTSSAPESAGTGLPPNKSGFTLQITDLSIDHKWSSHPAEEAYFVNDEFVSDNTQFPFTDSSFGYTFPSFPRLLPVPYPVVSPGQFQLEFRNSLGPDPDDDTVTGLNRDVQMTFLVMVPDGANTNARSGSSK